MYQNILAYISHFKHFYGQRFQPLAKQYGLSQLEIDILLFLHNNPQYNTARDIAQIRGFAKSNLSKALDSLKKQGYLAICPDPDNRKLNRLTLLPHYSDRIKMLCTCQEDCFRVLTQGFSQSDLDFMKQLFQRADGNIVTFLKTADTTGKEI